MALITLIRHAKTEPASIGQNDFDRKLLARGRSDSLKIAIWCKANLPPANIWLVSPAFRTDETANILATHWHKPVKHHQPEALYGASSTGILIMLEEFFSSEAEAADAHLLLIGHNPGVSDAAIELDQNVVTQHFPTGALAHFQTVQNVDFNLQHANSQCLHFITPTELPTPA